MALTPSKKTKSPFKDDQMEKWILSGRVNPHMAAYSSTELKEVEKEYKHPFYVMTFNLNASPNVGMILRTSVLSGAEKFIIAGRRAYDDRTTVGAKERIDIEYVSSFVITSLTKATESKDRRERVKYEYSLDAFVEYITENKIYPVFVEQAEDALSIYSDIDKLTDLYKRITDEGKKICFIFGNEGYGIPSEFLKHGTCVVIPQHGIIRCHNVAISAGAILPFFAHSCGFKEAP